MLVTTLERSRKQETKPHTHQNGQFVYVQTGVLNLRTDHGSWIVPEGRLGWIPKDKPHSAQALCAVAGWTILTDKRFEKILPKEICIIKASPLLLALLERIVHPNKEGEKFFKTIINLVLEELKSMETENLKVPLPKSRSLSTVALAVLDDLSSLNRLEDWAHMAGRSKRTFTRHFSSETGMTFDQWKKNAINLKAIELLAQGKQVSDVAYELGYESVSAFISMFKKHFGDTPMKFFKRTK